MKLEISTSELPDISSGPAALTVARAQVADLLHFEEPNENRAFRFQVYMRFTLWAHGKLGRRAAKIIPVYCTVAIRNKYPDPKGKYKVFFFGYKRILLINFILLYLFSYQVRLNTNVASLIPITKSRGIYQSIRLDVEGIQN